ncbi:hypothetical protein HY68_01330 [Streptomyces sp. AcH 505]|nr:hypothetical protein HY68_01330 [Streptomyces sp. AcH 505]
MIAKYVASLCPQQRFNEHTPDVWGDVLSPYDVNEARTAVVTVAARQPFISPAEIITEIKARREERIALAHAVYDGNPDETGVESAQAVRALFRAAADGRIEQRSITAGLGKGPDAPPALPSGRVKAILSAAAKEPPRTREGVVNVRGTSCQRCGARPGASCTSGDRRMADAHPIRLEDAKRAAAGLPPVDPAVEEREIARRIAASAARAAADTTHTPDCKDAT